MKKLRYRLFLALIVLVISVFIGLGLLLGQLFKTYYINSFFDEFQKEGNLIIQQIEDQGGTFTLQTDQIKKAKEMINANITILSTDGKVIYDIGETAEKYKDHHDVLSDIVKGIQTNKNGRKYIGSGLDIFYWWDVIEINGKVDGILVITSELDELTVAHKQLWLLLFVILGLAFIVIFFIGSKITTNFIKPVESATKTAIELAKGNYQARTYEYTYNEFSKLNSSLNILARNLQRITKEQEMQNDRLRAVIENMGIPLILIDDKGCIILTNQMYKEMFRVEETEIIGKTYLEVFEHEDVKQIIEHIFMTEQKIRRQITIPIHIQMKNLEVYGAPIISSNNEWKGIVLVFHDITEIKKLEKVRKDFVANVSHELKTPVTSIKGFTETLLDGALHDEKALESFLNIILKESNRLQSLVYDLLELSKIEQEDLKLNINQVEMNKMIHDIVDSLRKRAEDKQIDIQIFEERPLTVEGDSLRLQQIFINLLSNAIAYTLPSGKVEVHIQDDDEFVVISIADTGIGIEKEEIPRIFERFYRVDRARSRNSGGTGLGLAIVKHSVEAHHGEIHVESEVGKGSRFIVKLWKIMPKDIR